MGKIIAVANQKGGVGKTTTVVNLGAALAELGKQVLIVDFDSQGGASICLGITDPATKTIQQALFGEGEAPESFVIPTSVPNLFIIPSNNDLAAAELQLASELNRERFLARFLKPLKDRFDFILIDNSPSLGLLVINGLTAADEVLIPVQCAFMALKGLSQLLDTIEQVRTSDLQPNLALAGVLATLYNPSIRQCPEVVAALREEFGPKLFQTIIRHRSQYLYCQTVAQPVTVFDPKGDAAEMYRNVARELTGLPINQAGQAA